jgi:hypothetical protein
MKSEGRDSAGGAVSFFAIVIIGRSVTDEIADVQLDETRTRDSLPLQRKATEG